MLLPHGFRFLQALIASQIYGLSVLAPRHFPLSLAPIPVDTSNAGTVPRSQLPFNYVVQGLPIYTRLRIALDSLPQLVRPVLPVLS